MTETVDSREVTGQRGKGFGAGYNDRRAIPASRFPEARRDKISGVTHDDTPQGFSLGGGSR